MRKRVTTRGSDDDLVIYSYGGVSTLPSGCEPLFLHGERESFDLSWDWFRLMSSSALPAGVRPIFYVLEKSGKICGVLPLLLQKGAGVSQVQSMTSFYSSIYRPLLDDGVAAEELAVLLRRVLADTKVNRLRFDAMDPAHASYEKLEKALRLRGLVTFRFFCFGNHYLHTQGRSYAEYFRERPSKIRNTVHRREKKFLAEGRGRVEVVTQGTTMLDEVVRIWKTVYSSSWKVPEPYPDFMPGLIRLCAERGWLRLGVAYYDNLPVAAQIWIVSQGRAAIYKLAYDEKFAELSAGTLLTSYLMRQVMDVDKVDEIDYLVGDDAYKKDWMGNRRERWGIVAFNPWSLDGMLSALTQSLGMLRRKLVRNLGANLN